jgi:hypothetical protein
MQRALAYEHSPSPATTLRFLLSAPAFAILAGLLLAGYGEAALDSRWAAPALAITHLLTLGVLSMAMAGSMFQLIPVVAGQDLALTRAGAWLVWLGLGGGAMLLATAFVAGAPYLFLPAAVALAVAFGCWIAAVAAALARPAPSGAKPMLAGMRVAVGALVITALLGVALALALGKGVDVPLLLLTELHVGWGLVGWVAILVIGVAFQVIPMVQAIPAYPAAMTRFAPPALALLLLAWSATAISAGGSAWLPAMLLALALAGFAVFTLARLARSKRRPVEATTLYWRLSLACLAASAALSCVPVEHAVQPLLLGILFICGFGVSAVNGMLYKIVPFLLWYHLQQDPRAGRGDVPPLRTLAPDQAAQRQFWWHAAALAALLAAALWPGWLARPAGLLFAYAGLRLALDLLRATSRYRAIRRRLQPS